MNMKPSIYAGVLQQSGDDFNAVRDSRRAMPFYFDVDLSVARSGAGSAIFNIAGNSFYIDANPTDGTAFVEFQDTSNDAAPAHLYVSPGSIFNVPFTQIRLQNTAQAGKKIRIVYGVDIDFQPGSISQVAFTGAVNARPESQTGFFSDASAIVANTPLTVFTPAANVNGALLLSASMMGFFAAAFQSAVFITKNAPPAGVTDGSIVLQSSYTTAGAHTCLQADLNSPQFIAAGQGLYFISDVAMAAAAGNLRASRYKLL